MSDLQPPGAGLPGLEKYFVKFGFRAFANLCSDRMALRMFEKETRELVRIYEEDESYDVFDEKLIPRVIGIEDSSRRWSIAMVMEHLTMALGEMTLAVDSLSSGIVPHGEIDVALYKPDADIGTDVIFRFQDATDRYVTLIQDLLESHERLSFHPKFSHPWFGDLGAHQWHVLAAVHQRIHRRQAQKIVAMLGVT
jgi:hypothetical protein